MEAGLAAALPEDHQEVINKMKKDIGDILRKLCDEKKVEIGGLITLIGSFRGTGTRRSPPESTCRWA